MLEERNAKVLVETGTARNGLKNSRSDGASTMVFGSWADKNGALLYSIDHDMEAIAMAKKQALELEINDSIEFINADSLPCLTNFEQQVDFIYLDSFDYDKRNKEQQRLSQEHHLKEFQAIKPKLHAESLVLIDDCQLNGGGKGKLVIEFMMEKGWKIEIKSYQYLLKMR